VVERHLAKVNVASSNLVFRSTKYKEDVDNILSTSSFVLLDIMTVLPYDCSSMITNSF
jgi:hypothetical protein